jgi:hypothetical protein
MYIYESHVGSLYASEELYDYDYLYCETCGDNDRCLGFAENREEALFLFGDDYNEDYVNKFLDEYFPKK